MTVHTVRLLPLVAVVSAVATIPQIANAQTYPTRPLTLVVPFSAGGPSDVAGRVIAQRLSEVLGQQVVVENTVGAGETLQEIARSYNVSHPTIMRLFPSPFEQSEAASLAG